VRAIFDLSGSLTPLPGERDQNFMLESGSGERYVLKVSSPEEQDEILRFETEMLVRLSEKTQGLVPGVMQAQSGEHLVEYEDSDGGSHRLRIVEFLPGTLLANVQPRSEALLVDFGRRVAELDSALGGYPDHPPARIDFDWALGNSASVMERCLHLLQGEEKALVERALNAFNERGPDFLGLGSQIIHGDINDHNVLVSDPSGSDRYVTGFIDFGDAHSAPRVFDLAIAIAYAVLDVSDPLMAAAAITQGFHERTPLSLEEVHVVFTLARARLGASVSIAAWRRQEAEVVDEHLLVSERPAWDLLRTLDPINDTFATGVLRDACGLGACQRSVALTRWLSDREFEPVMEVPADESSTTVLDLSVGSFDLDGRDTEDTAAFSERVFSRMRKDGASLGIGRYLEPRGFYLTDAFAGRGLRCRGA
jgi:Ser/Thr protein kinase RdoA (MazF antagonist)